MRRLILVVAALTGAARLAAAADPAPLVDVQSIALGIRVQLAYASTDNIFARRFYASNTALLRELVARRLAKVQASLAKRGLGLLIWDAYRPSSVQGAMWKIKPNPQYLADPRKGGSKHSRGAAVDVTLVDRHGTPLSMPTPHDEFSPRAHRGATVGVPPLARTHARILDEAMREAGFLANKYEWWHFSAPDWRQYPLADRAVQ